MAAPADSSASPLPLVQPAAHAKEIDYELFLDCVHCGLATICPSFEQYTKAAPTPKNKEGSVVKKRPAQTQKRQPKKAA